MIPIMSISPEIFFAQLYNLRVSSQHKISTEMLGFLVSSLSTYYVSNFLLVANVLFFALIHFKICKESFRTRKCQLVNSAELIVFIIYHFEVMTTILKNIPFFRNYLL